MTWAPFHLDVNAVDSDGAEAEALIELYGPIERFDVEADRLAGFCGLVDHRVQECAAYPPITEFWQQAEIHDAERVGAVVYEEAPDRLIVHRYHVVFLARELLEIGQSLRTILHRQEGHSLVLIPVNQPEPIRVCAREYAIEERLVGCGGRPEADRAGQGPSHAFHQSLTKHRGTFRSQLHGCLRIEVALEANPVEFPVRGFRHTVGP